MTTDIDTGTVSGERKTYRVTVTKTVEVTFDMAKLDDEFWADFNSSITDRGGPDVEYLAEHAAWNFVQGEDQFIEGIGDLKEMGVVIRDVDSDIEAEAQP